MFTVTVDLGTRATFAMASCRIALNPASVRDGLHCTPSMRIVATTTAGGTDILDGLIPLLRVAEADADGWDEVYADG
jgi:hypothetical protein